MLRHISILLSVLCKYTHFAKSPCVKRDRNPKGKIAKYKFALIGKRLCIPVLFNYYKTFIDVK